MQISISWSINLKLNKFYYFYNYFFFLNCILINIKLCKCLLTMYTVWNSSPPHWPVIYIVLPVKNSTNLKLYCNKLIYKNYYLCLQIKLKIINKIKKLQGVWQGGSQPPKAFSNSSPTAKVLWSLYKFPMTWTPKGKPEELNPRGHCVDGNPSILKMAVYAKLKGWIIGWLWYGAGLGWDGYNSTPLSPNNSWIWLRRAAHLSFMCWWYSGPLCSIFSNTANIKAGSVWLDMKRHHFRISKPTLISPLIKIDNNRSYVYECVLLKKMSTR